MDGSTNLNNSADDRSYTYDAIGNRLTATADGDLTSYWADSAVTLPGANPLNQYVKTAYPSATLASIHDLDGNLKTGPLPGATALSPGMPAPSSGALTWDGENRLVKAVVNGITVNYAYDHLSRLISRSEGVSPTSSTHYLYDGWNRIAEYTYSGSQYTLAKTFLWGLDMSETPQGAGGVGGLLCIDAGSNARFYPAYDLNGNVIAYLDSSGQPAAHFQYDPFGNLTVDWNSNAADFPFRFSTKPQDPVTGLYYYGYRWYDAPNARWLSEDPIGEEGGLNLFGFNYNSPLYWYDYLGANPKPINGGFAFTGNTIESDDDWFRKKAKQGTGKNQNEGGTGKSLIDFLKMLTKDNCCIKKLNLASHGGPNGLGGTAPGISGFVDDKNEVKKIREEMNRVFPGIVDPSIHEEARDLNDLDKEIQSGGIVFCNKCEIRIYGCYQVELPSKLAKLSKCDVVAVKNTKCGPSTDKKQWNGDFHRFKPDGTSARIGYNFNPE